MKDVAQAQPLLTSLTLETAVLCADCEVISDSAGEVCCACGSRSLLSLGRVLGGTLGSERARIVEEDPERLRGGFTVLVSAGGNAALKRRRKSRIVGLSGRLGE
jgi:hypothetical protein